MVNSERLRQARQRAKLSQQRLGALIGQDQQYVSKLERGVLPGMTVETLERLADVLGCTTDHLLGRPACGEHATARVPPGDDTGPRP